ncbi:PQ loop repeat family protein [Tritrichomonas foetus]|uniref:PQ loop repeat family protein n=1 Tax=Tritrichomonas foetus TaxID=1144522 RepID=A0A1J4JL80_9EUKA|nr:PQ loop repeat family protein [Tritrichomonas foetus]|eukprot:OHS99842.1 PQ loop repeat family protein [Tritrichomonas foetus]
MPSPEYASITFTGFVDFSKCFPIPRLAWVAVGSIIFSGSVISVVPQIMSIVSRRSSFGLNPISIFITSVSQFILVINVISLHTEDFIGMFQFSFIETLPRFLTFLITFGLWFCYLIIPMLSLVFFDEEPRSSRPPNKVRQDKIINIILTCGIPISAFLFLMIYIIFGAKYGFASNYVFNFGGICGTIATIIGFAQYLPQMITTCVLKDPGSLSMILLWIQAPGGTANALFMWIAQGDHWTTWISILSASIQQFILIGICIYYTLKKKKEKIHQQEDDVYSIKSESVPSMKTPLYKPEAVFT